ncbi:MULTISPECIES: UDP-glucose dehydrogenase family protein [Glutamicibacter]|uniref:UDP-glucose 6-dehydrogenase n=1 Tax=Glutamicibacter nicotianae TaxID=37929 RepID=A0ABQ0RJA5_GLUNI|nr:MULTISPECIES: UDP-glucose/GDP-mannose dehydrogenase family protein [Glutamicibacter]UTM46663.1 UDP-glucose/GDP-mannose dehydrogenase family protein [Glutamicibacter mysorens]WIV42965.1 UDP-glucose/GDP-mannose dehydrogenase family protein [Glutamicibacter nicotianae]GEC11904.1 UDP-glucose 6-dehydrogenase [Glutamicibacter nicotianae]
MTLRISVIGTGYLGATHAACMAELGYEVIGLDVDTAKLEALAAGVLPFHEPGLPELLRKHVASGRLRFTDSYAEVAAGADIHFITVGTPQRADSQSADMSYVDGSVDSLLEHITGEALIVGKSTVPVGTARRLSEKIAQSAKQGSDIALAWNPEFLREGFAVQDTLRPDRLVYGLQDGRGLELLRKVYAPILALDTPEIATDLETAELVKVAANAFLATKISFINAFAEVTETVGGDIKVLADAIGHDKRIGRRFLNAGVGFGGGCLPKDIRALQARVSELGLSQTMGFLAEVDQINLRRRDRVVSLASHMLGNELAGKQVCVLGVTFKPDSDDVRDSPALDIAVRLYNEGAEVSVYDPEGNANAARRFPRLNYVDSCKEAAQKADLTLVLTEWNEFREMNPSDLADVVASKQLIDGRNVLDRPEWRKQGWTITGPGEYFELGNMAPATTSIPAQA